MLSLVLKNTRFFFKHIDQETKITTAISEISPLFLILDFCLNISIQAEVQSLKPYRLTWIVKVLITQYI